MSSRKVTLPYLDSRHIHRFINETSEKVYLMSVNYVYRKF